MTEEHLNKTTSTTWVNKYGKRMKPRDMLTRHLANTIAMLRRYGAKRKLQDELVCFGGLSQVGGDGAHDALESEINFLSRTTTHEYCLCNIPIYKTLWNELQLRAMG